MSSRRSTLNAERDSGDDHKLYGVHVSVETFTYRVQPLQPIRSLTKVSDILSELALNDTHRNDDGIRDSHACFRTPPERLWYSPAKRTF